MTDYESRIKIISKVLWDYNIPPEDCLAVLEGEKPNAGHYDLSSPI